MSRCFKSFAGLLLTLSIPLAGCTKSDSSTAGDTEQEDEHATAGAAAPKTRGKSAKPQPSGSPVVVLHTSLGDLTIKLHAAKAPQTVANFLRYVEIGHYNQTIFHQVDSGYVALAGGYTPDLREKSGRYPIPNEADNGLKNVRGAVAMARSPEDIDSSTCEFFINLNDNPSLDHRGDSPEEFGYCVFGEVIKGLEVLDQLAAIEVRDTDDFEKLPVETVLIETAYRKK